MRVSPVPPLTAGANPPHPPHSPHMSPAVGGPGSVVMPPHPGSGQSDSRPGNMHAPGYPPTAPPHMPSGPPPGPHSYPAKMGHIPPGGPPGPSYGQAGGYQAGHQYPPVRPQGPMMQPYPQNFPPGGPQTSQGPPSSMPPGHQYPPRPPHNNHVPPNQPYGYPPFGTQGWGAQGLNQGPPGPSMPSSMMTGAPGMSVKGGSVQMTGQVGQSGAGGVGGPRPHTPPHTSHYIHKHPIHKMGSYMGPQMYPNGPGMPGMPGMPNSSRESPQNNMPPPTSTPQPLTPSNTPLDSGDHGGVNNTPNPPSIGPDGNPLVDEASQQSTISNNSAASGEDRSGTPKPHKDGGMGSGPPGGPLSGVMGGGPPGGGGGQHPPSHPPTPSNSAPSPGAASMNSQQDEFETVNSPGWPRSPSTQTVYANSQPTQPPDIYRPSKPGENLARLYEMSDSPERRAWLDKLLSFMDENKTPITACPTISKNPLDLYALYLHVRERGGFVEVTKNKQWKDVAAVMGIGASSSGSYTLRKHYMKHILAYECKYDRGGVDPQPIVNQIEAAAKKKTTKTISVPSPGSSNSQDSFPAAGSNSSSMDGFSNGPHVGAGPGGVPGPYPQYPPSSEYPGHIPQRPPSQSTSAGYQGYQGGQYYQGMQGGYGQGAYPNSSYPPPDGRGYPPPGPPNHQSSYQANYQQPGTYQRPAYPPGQPGFQQDQYPGFQGGSMYPPGQKSGSAPSPGPAPSSVPAGYSGPRRHPDFEKNQPPGWPRPNSQFPGYTGQGQPPQQPWSRPSDAAPPGAPAAQWSQPRFPGAQPQYPGAGRGWSGGSYTQNVGPRSQAPGANKNYLVPPPSAFKCGTGLYGAFGKQQFPHDSVEAVLPVLARRKRMTRSDLQTCDPWRLLMSLRCGLAAEVTWALDVLNILLFDDQTVVYFGLHHLPGLLEALIEHLRRGLINMFDICSELELGRDDEATGANKRVKAEQHDSSDRPWYLRPPPSPTLDLDLGRLDDNDPANKEEVLRDGPDFTLVTKTGKNVKFVRREGELFLREGVREWDKWEGFSSGVDTWSVGGGECTAHIICNMQSSVPPLVFTRLLPGRDGMTRDTARLEEVKEEEMVVEVKKEKEEEEEKEEKPKVVLMEEKKKVVEMVEVKEEPVKKDRVVELLAEMKEKKMVDLISREKCDNSKDNESSDKLFSQRVNKVNNMRRSKLDEIFKKLKKEPIEDISDNKNSAKETKDVSCVVKKEIEMQDCSTVTVKQEPSSDKKEESEAEQEGAGVKLVPPPPPLPLHRQDRLERRESGGSRRESSGFKRPHEDLEEESWGPDEASLSTTTEGQDWLARRVICVGTVIRNLSFIPGNEDIMSKSASLLALLGKTILLHHQHPHRTPSTAHYDRDEEADLSDWCSSLAPDTHWWWPYLHHVHENTLVTLANMAGNLDLSVYPEEISRPLLNGLLHWATCPASYGQDPFPAGGTTIQSALSPQRLALEALVKLCVLDQNTDLVLATPPFIRLDNLCGQLTRFMCRGEDQVLREFSINLLHYFSAADSGVARVIAMQNGCVSLLVAFIEEAEAAAMNVANVQGVSALKENPELMGTSLDMVRRSANTLVHLSRVPANARVISSTENRLLTLVMSQILDTYVASQLSQVLFNVANVQIDLSQYSSPSTTPVPKSQLAATAQAVATAAATAAVAVAAAAVVPAAAAAAATAATAAAAAAAAAVVETPATTVTATATTLSANPDETLNAKSSQQPDVPSSQSSPTAAITNHVSAACDSDKPSAASSPSATPPAPAIITPTPSSNLTTTPSSNLTTTTTTANATAAPTTITTLTSLPNTTTTLTLGKIPPTTNSIPTPTPSLAPAPPPSILAPIPAPTTTPIFAPQLSLSVKPTSTLTGHPPQAATSPDMTPKCEPLAQAPAPAPAPMPMEAPAANTSS